MCARTVCCCVKVVIAVRASAWREGVGRERGLGLEGLEFVDRLCSLDAPLNTAGCRRVERCGQTRRQPRANGTGTGAVHAIPACSAPKEREGAAPRAAHARTKLHDSRAHLAPGFLRALAARLLLARVLRPSEATVWEYNRRGHVPRRDRLPVVASRQRRRSAHRLGGQHVELATQQRKKRDFGGSGGRRLRRLQRAWRRRRLKAGRLHDELRRAEVAGGHRMPAEEPRPARRGRRHLSLHLGRRKGRAEVCDHRRAALAQCAVRGADDVDLHHTQGAGSRGTAWRRLRASTVGCSGLVLRATPCGLGAWAAGRLMQCERACCARM